MSHFEIFLKIHNICWAHTNLPKTWRALHQAFRAGVKAGELPSIQKSELFICHPQHSVYYSNFALADIVNGSLIECRNHVYQKAVHMYGASDVVSGRPLLKHSSTEGSTEKKLQWSSIRTFLHPFVTSEEAWSKKAFVWALVTTAFYTGSCVGYAVISTPRHYKRYLSVSDPYFIVELAASFFCALEIAFHIIVKGPVRELLSNTWTCGVRVFEITYLRVTFITRLLNTIPSTRGGMMACIETFRQSAKLLYMLLFFAMLALLMNASIVYYLERGTYHLNAGTWMQHAGWQCEFVWEIDSPETLAAYVAGAVAMESGWNTYRTCKFVRQLTDTTHDGCEEIWEPSQIHSIPEAMWLVLPTLTTVGYGDRVPVTVLGKAFMSLVIYMGVLTLALPITVISSKFEGNWRRFKL